MKKKKIIFVTGLFPLEQRELISKKSKGVIQYAADALQWAIVKGINSQLKDIQIVNLPYIGSFPNRYQDLYFPSFNFEHGTSLKGKNVGFNNLTLYKFISRYNNLKKTLKELLKDSPGETVILIYALHIPFLKAAIDVKKSGGVKICQIVPDLPEFMEGEKNLLNNLLRKYQKELFKEYLKEVDAFVVLTQHMLKPLKVGERPSICVEGIYDNQSGTEEYPKSVNSKVIFYSGTLSPRYGIKNLLDAFELIKDSNFELWICGEGEMKTDILSRLQFDCRITYFGQIDRNRVLDLQRKATILLNPRTSEGEFTKYSFPSKILEYFASGTPVIMHKLPGIPEEYFQHCFICLREDAEGLKDMIIQVSKMEQESLREIGLKAQKFVLTNKNPVVQSKKILNLINDL